jgi:hypothetical protein
MHELFAGDFAAIVTFLNGAYDRLPTGTDLNAWATERQILWEAFCAYQCYWKNDNIEFVDKEHYFAQYNSDSDFYERTGTIDAIGKWRGRICVIERKSTASDISAGSDYWRKLNTNEQISMYLLAARDKGLDFGSVCYDVWKKPGISPAFLTQRETADILTTGKYCGRKFSCSPEADCYNINGERAEIKIGVKGNSVKETPKMYGARLAQELAVNPGKYFARHEIARTEAELDKFQKQLYNVTKTIEYVKQNNLWFENWGACENFGRCQFYSLCHGPGAEQYCGTDELPEGFTRKGGSDRP